jgi:4-hydroxy-tetrahydrodipicolinate synthase
MIRYEAQPGMGLAIRKHSLVLQGIIAHPTLRRPGAGLAPRAVAEVDALARRQARRLEGLGLN